MAHKLSQNNARLNLRAFVNNILASIAHVNHLWYLKRYFKRHFSQELLDFPQVSVAYKLKDLALVGDNFVVLVLIAQCLVREALNMDIINFSDRPRTHVKLNP